MSSQPHLLSRIRQHFLSGQFDQATELCIDGLAESPDNNELHYLLALCDEKAGKVDEAVNRLRMVVGDDSHHAESRFELGRLLALAGERKQARELFNACLELDPGHAPARTMRARLDQLEGRDQEAVSGLKTALRADQDHVPALISLTELMLDAGDIEQANQHASHALQVAPEDPSVQMAMARVFMDQGHFAFAERCLANAIDSDPDNPHVHWAMGNLLQRAGRHEEAINAYQTARRLGLNDRRLARGLAISLARAGRLHDARILFEQLMTSGPDRQVVMELADLYAETGDENALTALLEQSEERSEQVRRWLEALHGEVSGNLEQGLAVARELTSSDDLDLQVRARLLAARLNLRLDRYEPVVDVLEPLLDNPRLTHPVVWEMARLLREAGHFDPAARALGRLTERRDLDDESKARTEAMRIDVLDRAGHHEEAARLFQAAAWQPPYLGNPAYLTRSSETDQPDLSPVSGYEWPAVDEHAADEYPVFVTGWPCTGRDLVIAGLGVSGKLRALPLADWPQRQQHLRLPLDLDRFRQIDDAQIHLMRKRYLRGRSGSARVLETAAVQPWDLAQIARLFPGTVLINPVAGENYLRMQWRLLGYRQVPSMIKAWRRDQDLLEGLRGRLPLRIMDVALDDLLTEPAPVLKSLSEVLGLSYDEDMRQAVEQMASARGYRPPLHWKNYFPDD